MIQILQRWLGEDLNAEKGGQTWRLIYGDLARWSETEGGDRQGAQLLLDIGFGDYLGDFDIDETHFDHTLRKFVRDSPKRTFLTHWICLQIGRWGVSLNWRGREITGTDWEIPRWKLDRAGKLLPEWAD